MQAGFLELSAHVIAEFAIHRRPDLVVVVEREGDGIDATDRHHGLIDAGSRHEVERSGARLREHVRLTAQLTIRIDLQVDKPVVLRRERLSSLLDARDPGMVSRECRAIAELVLGPLRNGWARETAFEGEHARTDET